MPTHAHEARLAGAELDRRSGRARLSYALDGWRHVIHAVFHNAPELDPDTWALCLDDLALAGLVDVVTAGLARHVTAKGLTSANGARSWVAPAAHALPWSASPNWSCRSLTCGPSSTSAAAAGGRGRG